MDVLGTNVPISFGKFSMPTFMANTWLWVAVVVVIGLFAIIGVAILLFFKTYRKKVIVFENIAGQGYHPVLKTRARVVKVSQKGGEELLKTLVGNHYTTAYGRKMGKNTYWFAVGPDGYWYNVILGDLDTKMGILDIEPIDRDVRMFHVALDRLAQQDYGQKSKLPMIMMGAGIFIVLIILLIGMYVVAGRFVDAAQSLSTTADANAKVIKTLNGVLQGASNIQSQTTGGSGIVPAS